MRSLWPQLAAWLESPAEAGFALATVTAVSGSAPRAPGSCMAIMPENSRFIGSVSSGCLDVEVVDAARVALRTGTTQHLRFGPDGNPPWTDGLTCGGWIAVRIEPWWGNHPRAEVRAIAPVIRRWLERDEGGVVVSSDTHHVAIDGEGHAVGDVGVFAAAIVAEAREHLRAELPPCEVTRPTALADGPPLSRGDLISSPLEGRAPTQVGGRVFSGDEERNDQRIFLRTIRRRPRLLIVGGVDVTVHLVAFARESGWATTVIDPRAPFVAAERFSTPPDNLVRAWPQEAIAQAALGPRDAALVLTHDPKIDDVALRALLQTRAGYVGALGSTRSHAARLERLRALGADAAALARIQGPAGIHLGTPDAAGIALGIAGGLARWQAARERQEVVLQPQR